MKLKTVKYSTAPVVSKIYCSSSQVVLVVRRRPHVTNGGGFVVTDCNHKVVFRVDGCGILGELLLKDGNGDPLLLIRRKGGVVQAVSINKKWKGYANFESPKMELVFTLREGRGGMMRIWREAGSRRAWVCGKDWDLEIKGYFPDRACTIVDANGNTIAQLGVRKEVLLKDVYHVSLNPGADQAFVFGVIAVLDYVYAQSTTSSTS